MFSDALNQRSVAQTSTPNSRCKKIDDEALPQPRSSTRIPGRRSIAVVNHSANHNELPPPLALATTHSGLYLFERKKRSFTSLLESTDMGPVREPLSSRQDTTCVCVELMIGRPSNPLCVLEQCEGIGALIVLSD